MVVGDPEPSGGGKINTIVFQGDGSLVYLTDDYGISWMTEEHYSDFPDDFGLVNNKVLFLEGITNNLYSGRKLRSTNYLLAQGLARILDDKHSRNANQILVEFEKSLEEQGRQLLKIEFVVSSFFTTFFLLVILSLSWIFRFNIELMLGKDAFDVLIAAYCGGIGAFVSSFIRSLNFTADIRVPKLVYSLDGALRIFYGVIAGFIISLAVKSNVLFGVVNDLKGISMVLICFLATIAGASEYLVPSIIKKVEQKV